MVPSTKPLEKADPTSRFVWQDDDEIEIVRYDEEARSETVQALLAESREMLK